MEIQLIATHTVNYIPKINVIDFRQLLLAFIFSIECMILIQNDFVKRENCKRHTQSISLDYSVGIL